MYTQVTHAEMVIEMLSRIGSELGIEFKETSLSDLNSYQTGEWFYENDMHRIRVFRWGTGREEWVTGFPHWSENQEDFEAKLEQALREKISLLSEPETGLQARQEE